MGKYIKYISIAFLVFSSVLCVISTTTFCKSTEIVSVYTRNNLSWDNADVSEDGSISLDLTNGETTVQLKNNVKGRIGYNIYLYTEKETSAEVNLPKKDMAEIDKNEYPYSLRKCDVKCAYRGYLNGNRKKDFQIKSTATTNLRLLLIIEDNNSYSKSEKNIPAIANVKFSAEVLLDGQYARGNDYSFSLKDETGAEIEAVRNDDGYISFSNISIGEKGTYIYYISQNQGTDEETIYDNSVYKITVVTEENTARIFYEKDGTPKETLPRFSNYKLNKDIIGTTNIAEFPSNEKKSNEQTNYLLLSTLAICFLLILFYIVIGKKKG